MIFEHLGSCQSISFPLLFKCFFLVLWVTSRVLRNILWELLYSQHCHNASQRMTLWEVFMPEKTAPALFAADFQILAQQTPVFEQQMQQHVLPIAIALRERSSKAGYSIRIALFCKLAIQKIHDLSAVPSRHRYSQCEPKTCDQARDWRRGSENHIIKGEKENIQRRTSSIQHVR